MLDLLRLDSIFERLGGFRMLADNSQPTAEINAELQQISERLGGQVNLIYGDQPARRKRMSQLITDLKRMRELLPPSLKFCPGPIGPIPVSGNLCENILKALENSWEAEEIACLRKELGSDTDVIPEAEDILTSDLFSVISLRHTDPVRFACERFIFEIPEGNLGEAFNQLGSFMIEYCDQANTASVYVFGNAEHLLQLLTCISLQGLVHCESALTR